jgi:hypothetical protein
LDKVHPDQKKILPSFCPLGKKGADWKRLSNV